jgi:uncharacterized protein
VRLLLALVLASCTQEVLVARATKNIEDAAVAKTPLRVASLNVHLLFDETCDSGVCNDTSFEKAPTNAEVDARVSLIAEKLTALDAQIIVLEEVETQALLDRIAAKMPRIVTHELAEIGRSATIDVGVLSTLPLVELKHHHEQVLTRPDGTVTTFARDLPEAHFLIAGKRVIVFGAHFKSKADDDPGRRFAEAEATRDLMRAAAKDHPGAVVVLGGDLNDEPGSAPINALEVVATRLSEGPTWFRSDGTGIPLDHIFVERAGAMYFVAGSFRVVRDPVGRGYAESDHAAVVADFSLF